MKVEKARAAARKVLRETKWCKKHPKECVMLVAAIVTLVEELLKLARFPFGAGAGGGRVIREELESISNKFKAPLELVEKAYQAAQKEYLEG